MAWCGNFLTTYWRGAVAFVGLSPAAILALYLAGLPLNSLVAACIAVVAVNFHLSKAIIRENCARLEDVRERHASAELLLTKAHCDPVTGLLNRFGGDDQLPALSDNLHGEEKLILMTIDLRRFRDSNNALGQTLGDDLLRQVGRRLQETAPECAVISRFSGDRFQLAARMPSRQSARDLAARIDAVMAAPLHIGGHRITNGAAIGTAMLPGDAGTLEDLQKAVDLALYSARSASTGQMRFYETGMIRDFDHQKQLEAELRDAIMKDDVSVRFQPIVDLRTGRTRAMEAQARWAHARRGELGLDEMIAGMQPCGPVITLGNWIIAEAAKAAACWPGDVMLTIKLVSAQIDAPGAALGILAALRKAGLAPSRLEVQVSASLFDHPGGGFAQFAEQLGRVGVTFTIDDAEITRTAITQLERYPFERMMINTKRSSDGVLNAMVGLGRSLGLEVVAVGLKTAAQLSEARSAGCTLGQGGHLGKAVPAEIALEMLESEDEASTCNVFGACKLAG